jgi:transcriptional regulator with XRE-family HTH domain
MTIAQTSSGELFLAWRTEMGFTWVQAAKALGKSLRMIGHYEAGFPVPVTVLLLMDALRQGYRPSK